MRALAHVTTAAPTPLAVFHHNRVPGQMFSLSGLHDSPAGLKLLTSDLVVLGVASGDE